MVSKFIAWLQGQSGRQDRVGFLARRLPHLRIHAGSVKLSVLLRDLDEYPDMRAAMKTAHREWRQVRDGKIDKAPQQLEERAS